MTNPKFYWLLVMKGIYLQAIHKANQKKIIYTKSF